jgi:Kef-type K+ transport system membrane component KefB
MLLGTLVAFMLIGYYGDTLWTPRDRVAPIADPSTAHDHTPLLRVLVALAAVIALGQALARLFVFLGQPPVIGEVVAGILLGPSLLGEPASSMLLPTSVAPLLGIIAQLGIILYMFLVGLELNASVLRSRAHATVMISHASIIVPFLLGALLAFLLYPTLAFREVPFTTFALFLGVAMSVTAFPVLARILADMNLARSELGILALTCAAIDDVTAWCLLALVAGVARSQEVAGLWVAAGTAAYVAFMLLFVRPIAQRFARPGVSHLPRAGVALVYLALLFSSLATEWIGIHAVFGAFLLGAVIPHDSKLAQDFTRRLHDLVTLLLLPAFFAFTGMRTRIDLLTGLDHWLLCGLITLVAVAGKVGGTMIAGRFTGLDWRQSAALGTLMNTRGLMELIVLNVGLDLKVISPILFAMMVLMALATTLVTVPALQWQLRRPLADSLSLLLKQPPQQESQAAQQYEGHDSQGAVKDGA